MNQELINAAQDKIAIMTSIIETYNKSQTLPSDMRNTVRKELKEMTNNIFKTD